MKKKIVILLKILFLAIVFYYPVSDTIEWMNGYQPLTLWSFLKFLFWLFVGTFALCIVFYKNIYMYLPDNNENVKIKNKKTAKNTSNSIKTAKILGKTLKAFTTKKSIKSWNPNKRSRMSNGTRKQI